MAKYVKPVMEVVELKDDLKTFSICTTDNQAVTSCTSNVGFAFGSCADCEDTSGGR